MKNQEGLTLLELIVSIGALTIILSALTVATVSSLNNSTYSKNQNLATQYAQAAIEGLRQANDADYGNFKTYNGGAFGPYCYSSACSPFSASLCGSGSTTCTSILNTSFKRYVTISQGSASCQNGAYVTATVAWTDGKCTSGSLCQKVVVSSCIAAPAATQVQ